MKTEETNRQDARKIFYECLKTLGFSIYTLNEFFYFLWNCTKEAEDLIRKIDWGVVVKHFSDIHWRANWSSHAFNRRNERYYITDKASFVAAMTVNSRNEELEGDMELILRTRADFDILTDKKLAETRRLLFTSFMEGFLFDHSHLNACVNHWRGLLDTRRVDLKLAGKDDYPKDIKQADLFLRILYEVGQPRPKVKRRYRKADRHGSGEV